MSAYATHGGHKKYCHVLSNRGKYLHLYINIYLTNRKACVKVIDLTVKLLRRNIDKTDLVWTGSNLNWSKLPGCGCAAPHLPYQIPSVLPYLPLHKQARHCRFNCYFQLRLLRRT